MNLLPPAAHRPVRWLALCAYLLTMTAWAAHYTGTYADAEGTVLEITHDAQGNFTGRLHTDGGTRRATGAPPWLGTYPVRPDADERSS